MQIIRNYVFTCAAKNQSFSSKHRLKKSYADENKYLSDADLTKLMNKKAFGKFTFEGDEWQFKTIFVDRKAPKITERKYAETIIREPYTKRVGDFLVTYSGHTHKPIKTQMYSPSKTTV